VEVALLCFASGATETSPLDFAYVCAAAADGSRPCLIPKKFCKIFQIPHHIESLDVYMEY